MITLLHGDNNLASRNALNAFIENANREGTVETIRLDGEKLNLTDFKHAIEAQSMFTALRIVIIENLLSRKPSQTKDELITYLDSAEDMNLYMWERRTMTPVQLKKLPKSTRIQLYKLSSFIFRFLDALAPDNTRNMITLLHESQKQDPPEVVFVMLSRRVHDLILASDRGSQALHSKADWQRSRIMNQARHFSLPVLLALHECLYRLDKSIKTGRNILPLPSLLDILVSEI